jgi:predicted SnoaL-like aldol condensation-catalyzing enzyme
MGRRSRTLLLVPVLAAGLLLPGLAGPATAAPAAPATPAGAGDAGWWGSSSVQERLNSLRVRALYAEVFSRHRLDRAERYLDRDVIQHTPTVGQGLAGFTAFYRDVFFPAFPDVRAQITSLIAQNDRVATYATWTGHHAATGRPLTLYTADIYRFEQGRIAEHWDVIDYSGLDDFGVPVPDQMQPPTAVDWRGSPADLANIRLVLDFTTEVLQQRRLDRAGAYLAEDLIQHEPTIPPGLAGFQGCFHRYFGGFPDMTFEIQHVLANSEHVVVFWVWRGHQVGTGRPLVLHTSDMYRVADGLLVEHWNTVDFTALEPFGIARP